MRHYCLAVIACCCICLAGATTASADFVDVVSENAKRPAPTFGTVDNVGDASRHAGGGPGCGDGVCHCEETCDTCPIDCGVCGGCGNGVCDEDDGGCPASSCTGDTIIHSQSMEIVVGVGIACGNDDTTTPNAWARCFDLEEEGFVGDVVINSIDFGTESSLPFDVPVFANLYVTLLGCPASGFGTSGTILIASKEIIVGPADAGLLVNAEFDIPVEIAAGSTVIVEIEVLASGQKGGWALFPGANSAGQCCVTSLRAAACDWPDWRDVASIGFPDFHLALRANVYTEECALPGGGENCDTCPQDCGDCDGCGDCPTDLDASGDTDPFDLAALLAAWGPCSAGDPCQCLDANGDASIGPFDLATLLSNWGSCP